jgi:hypothetical protein
MLSIETLDIRALGDGRDGGGHGPGRNRNRTSVKSGHKASEGPWIIGELAGVAVRYTRVMYQVHRRRVQNISSISPFGS